MGNQVPKKDRVLVLHVDVNETAIAGDTSKGHTAEQTLQLVASKNIKHNDNYTLYDWIERENSGQRQRKLQKDAVESLVLSWLQDQQNAGTPTVRNIQSKTQAYQKGCTEIESVLVFKNFLELVNHIREQNQQCIVVFRSFGADISKLVKALFARNIIDKHNGCWLGYGEFDYAYGDAYVKKPTMQPNKLGEARLKFRWKFNPVHTNVNAFEDDPTDPVTHDGLTKFWTEQLPNIMRNKGLRLAFAGVRDTFDAWQRNQCSLSRGKPLHLPAVPGAVWQMFLDDNAYEKGYKNGPYIVTVYRGGRTTDANARHPEVVRPEREKAYVQRNYYVRLLKTFVNHMESRGTWSRQP